MNARILVADDERLIRWSVCERLKQEGYEALAAADGREALKIIDEGGLDMALLDMRLPDTDGLALMAHLKEVSPSTPVVFITAYSSIDNAVEAMKSGAFDYVTKPFNMDELALSVRRALENALLRERVASHISEQKARFGLASLIGESGSMRTVKDLVMRVAQGGSTAVLLLGESGTGKDMLARAIHYESVRVDKPFVNITCTALPESLLEAELFGFEKGAFTDAKAQKKGLFEIADGGTVFLDEIGDMPTSLQAKLLRVLEDKTFRRVGGTADIGVDVRVVAATNRDIDEAIAKGHFREDLYYRLSTVPIVIPALRERRDDIGRLAVHFLAFFSREFRRPLQGFAPAALAKMEYYDWPGNVRELRNVVERAALLTEGETVGGDDIVLGRSAFRPAAARQQNDTLVRLPEEGCVLEEVERDLVRQAMERVQGNQTRAAELLGVTRDQIRYKIAKFGLSG